MTIAIIVVVAIIVIVLRVGEIQRILTATRSAFDPYQRKSNSARSRRNARKAPYFAARIGRTWGVWKRDGKRDVVPILIFITKPPRYRPVLDFEAVAAETARNYIELRAFQRRVEIARNTPLGFAISDDETGITYDDMKNRIMGELKKVFRPEFLNRIDDVIVFHKLQKDEIKTIIELLLRRIRESLAERELQLELTEDAKDYLVDKGWDPSMGARPLRRAIQRYIEDPLADFVLANELVPGGTVLVEVVERDGEKVPELKLIPPAEPREPIAVGADSSAEEEEAEEASEQVDES